MKLQLPIRTDSTRCILKYGRSKSYEGLSYKGTSYNLMILGKRSLKLRR